MLTGAPPSCEAPPEFTGTDASFESVAAVMKPGQKLEVLAVGSATMLGPNRNAEGSFPYRMADQLRQAVPGLDVKLTVRSGRGMTATDMVTTLRSELATHGYQLVLWQTGTVEAVRNLPPDDFLDTLTQGIQAGPRRARRSVLIDPQYSRFLQSNANLDPYLLAMRQAGALADAALFRRFDLMKYWVDAGPDRSRAGRTGAAPGGREFAPRLSRPALGQLVLQAAGIAAP